MNVATFILMLLPVAVAIIVGLTGVIAVPRRRGYEFIQFYTGLLVASTFVAATGLGVCALIANTSIFGYVFGAIGWSVAGTALLAFRPRLLR